MTTPTPWLKRPLFNGWSLYWLIAGSVSLVMMLAWARTDTADPLGVSSLIQLSVRLAVPWLFIVFVASALQILRPGGFSLWLLRNRKYLGLVFATAMAWQALFILWLVTVHRDYYVSEVYLLGDALSGVIGYTFLSAMTITSFMPVRKLMRPRHWKWLHKAGIYVLWAYAVSTYWWSHAYYENPVPLDYIFYAAAATAWLLRIVAWRKKRMKKGQIAEPRGEVPAAFMALGALLVALGVLAMFTGPLWQAAAGEVLYGTPGTAWANLSAWAETRVPQWAFQPFLPLLLIIPGMWLTSRIVPQATGQPVNA